MFCLGGIVVGLSILAFFLNAAAINGFSCRLLNESKKPLLPVCHECIKCVRAEKRRVDQMGCDVGIEMRGINRRRFGIALLQFCDVLGGGTASQYPIRPK